MHQPRLREVLEADAGSLLSMSLELEPNSELGFYLRALQSYFRADEAALRELWLVANAIPEWQMISFLIAMRLAVRRASDSLPCEELPVTACPLWGGEIDFVVAMFYENNGQYELAKKYYVHSQTKFHRGGAKRKAAKAYHNSVVCESRIRPSSRLIPEYQAAASLARDAGDFTTTAAALNNLSREFQLMGANFVALKYVTESIELLSVHAYGTYNFYASLCHRCQINLELGHVSAALVDFQEAMVSNLVEIKTALKVIEELMARMGLTPSLRVIVGQNDYLLPSWRERKESSIDAKVLSRLESLLIESLANGIGDKFILIEKIWGDRENIFDLDNRFKQLVHRIRKKNSHLIGYANGAYYLLNSASIR